MRLALAEMEEVHVDGIRHSLPAIGIAEIACDIPHQFLRHGDDQIGLLVCLAEQWYLPGTAGCRAELLLKHQPRKMLRNDVRDLILPADLHRRIASPLGTMRMKYVRTTIMGDVVIEHLADDSHPSTYIPPDHHRHAPLERLTDDDAVTLMFIPAERQ